MLHIHSQGLSFYDINPRQRARGPMQQQVKFGDKVKADAKRRQVRLLADRVSGRLAVIIDGALVMQFAPKPADGPRSLGRGILLMPQSNLPCTFSNLWVGPWSGQMPGKDSQTAPETVVLANGDEVLGSIGGMTATGLKVESEVGPLELPLDRLTMIDFGGPSPEPTPGQRLHLAGFGSLTMDAWRVENGFVTLHSAVAGNLKLPLAVVRELVMATQKPQASAAPVP